MTNYEKVIEDIHQHVDESMLKTDLAIALFDESTKEEEVKQLFKMYYTKELIDLTLLKECVSFFVRQNQSMVYNDELCKRACQLHNDIPKEIEEYTFYLVVSTNGYERLLGRQLWDKLGIGETEMNILSYSEDLQCRFAISIVQDFVSPKKRLPQLLCLFNSSYPTVRQILINVLSLYTLNYFGLVKREFESRQLEDSDELLMFKEFIISCNNRFNLYRECVELHSEYSMPAVFEICNREASNYMREQAEKVERLGEPSFMDFVTKVHLGRGGGWRKDDGTVHPLQHIQFSVEVPMMISSMTPLESREYSQMFFQDWTKIENKDEK